MWKNQEQGLTCHFQLCCCCSSASKEKSGAKSRCQERLEGSKGISLMGVGRRGENLVLNETRGLGWIKSKLAVGRHEQTGTSARVTSRVDVGQWWRERRGRYQTKKK